MPSIKLKACTIINKYVAQLVKKTKEHNSEIPGSNIPPEPHKEQHQVLNPDDLAIDFKTLD